MLVKMSQQLSVKSCFKCPNSYVEKKRWKNSDGGWSTKNRQHLSVASSNRTSKWQQQSQGARAQWMSVVGFPVEVINAFRHFWYIPDYKTSAKVSLLIPSEFWLYLKNKTLTRGHLSQSKVQKSTDSLLSLPYCVFISTGVCAPIISPSGAG